MKYLIAQDWPNTKGNHAGMVHMCKLLVERYPNDYKMIVKDCPPKRKRRSNPFSRMIMKKYDDELYRKQFVEDYMRICFDMFSKLRKGDEVFLLEYNWPSTTQFELACAIKSNFDGVYIYALSHLTPTYFEKEKDVRKRIMKWDRPIDKHLTLGTSLSCYFRSLGIPNVKISTGFHYVDNDYYNPTKTTNKRNNDKLTIITMGFLQRDYNLLVDIVKGTPDVDWIICRGRNVEIDKMFPPRSNIHIFGFLKEDELREQMGMADVSLNVMEDTVGSNVITTSMSMGLVLIVSDVGSIRDYCDETNAVFCLNTPQSFIDAINVLSSKSSDDIDAMSERSIKLSSNWGIENVHTWFSALQ